MNQILLEGLGSGVISGVIAGLVAWMLLKQTQKRDAKDRVTERREAAARSLIPAIRDTADTATKGRAALAGKYHLFELRNQVALAEGPLRGTPALLEVREFYETLVKLRIWVRDAPAQTLGELQNSQSSIRIGWGRHGDGLNRWADYLVELLHQSYDGSTPAVTRRPEQFPLPSSGPEVGASET